MKYVIWVVLIAWRPAVAQYYFYNDRYLDQPLLLGLSAASGGMNCLTDLGKGAESGWGWKQVDWHAYHPAFQLGLSLNWKQQFGLRLEFGHGMVTAADSVLQGQGGNAGFRFQRNLHFRSRIHEALLLFECYPIGLIEPARPGKWAPFLFGGIGLFHFRPQACLSGQWTDLHPLRTEGQDPGTMYALTQLNFPAGVGLRYEVSALTSVAIEVNYRFLSTDYLDDVSTRFIDPNLTKRRPNEETLLKQLYQLSWNSPARRVIFPGAIRGDPESRDSYFSLTCRAVWVLNRKRLHP